MKEKALNYLNDKGFIFISSNDKATLLLKGSLSACVYDDKTSFQNHKNWSLTKINHDDIENYDFIDNEIVSKGGEKTIMRVKELREKAGISRFQLSQMTGMSERTLEGYEQGRRDLKEASYNNLKRLADVFGMTIEELVEK